MLPRFLATEIDPASGTAVLAGDEAHHLSHVMRLRAGDEIAVFDGRGREFRARIERVSRGGASLRLLDAIQPAAEPAVHLTLAQAVLKGEKMDNVVRDATMMGVSAVQPVVTEHTAVRRAASQDGKAQERWRRVAIASAKQCRRAVLPEIGAGVAFADWVAQDAAALRLLLAEPSADVQAHGLAALNGPRPASASLLVGPEGGWSATEVEMALRAGWTAITFGRRTLRADAVAIVAIGVLQYLWGDL